MNPILEYDDLRKAGRAVVITSFLVILTSECTAPFKEINFLGINVGFGLGELIVILWFLLVIYTINFLFFLFSENPLYATDKLRIQRDNRVQQRHEDIRHLSAELDASLKTQRDQVRRNRKIDVFERDNKENAIVERQGQLSKKNNQKKKRASQYFGWVFRFEAARFWLFQVAAPVLLLAVALTPLSNFFGEQVCPNFTP